MANPHPELLEIILRECAAANPQPWYPAEFVQATGMAREHIEATLDELRLGGLVALTPWMQGHGQGYQLTPHGKQVFEHPRLLAQVRAGSLPEPRMEAAAPSLERHALENLRGEQVRSALMDDSRPIVTQTLLAANVIWFLVGLAVYITRYGGSAGGYLGAGPMGGPGDPGLNATYIDIGSLSFLKVVGENQWWRLLSAGFAHAGILHLGMNMYALYVLGPLLERMWGRAAFLAIYLISGLGCCAASLLLSPGGNALGASGSICGLLGAMATWVYLNRHALPPHIVLAWRSGIITNVILLAIISMLPGVSWEGHLGGGLTGLAIGIPLNLARFGTPAQKFLGWAIALALTAGGLVLLPFRLNAVHEELIQRIQAKLEGRAKDAQVPREEREKRLEALSKDPSNQVMLQSEEIADEGLKFATKLLNGRINRLEKEEAVKLQTQFAKSQAELNTGVRFLGTKRKAMIPEQGASVVSAVRYMQATGNFFGEMAKALAADKKLEQQEIIRLRAAHQSATAMHQEFKTAWKKMEDAWPKG